MFRYFKSIIPSDFVVVRLGSYRKVSYVQGQSPKKNVREYFYYIDHQGMLFLDDSRMKNFTSCFKDKQFLTFFFKRVKLNNTGRFSEEFPWVSPCGREFNYIRCDDVPVVFTSLETGEDGKERLGENFSGGMSTELKPELLAMDDSGRLYHPAREVTGGVGLVASRLAVKICESFQWSTPGGPPTGIQWSGKFIPLCSDWLHIARSRLPAIQQ